ncbi:MAG: chemotaxis protein CheD [Deltaproteobacteria bacterium]|nr:chemotaxis protein CheD [Deltaproteobacteria bacterium]
MIITVGMGEGIVAAAPHILRAIGCGSCVILTLYECERKVGGLAHIMLPRKAALARRPAPEGEDKYCYADTAISSLLEQLRKMGVLRKNIVARMAGGAGMFPSYSVADAGIGRQNIESVRDILRREGIHLAGWDTGGNHGRNVEFHLDSGRVVVTAFGRADREI